MSASAVSLDSNDSAMRYFEAAKESIANPQNWLYLVPTIGALAIGVIFAPNFAIGMAAGAGILAAMAVVSIVMNAAGLTKKDENSEYEKSILENPWLGTLVAPIAEEGIFRGLIQPLAMRCVLWAIPAAGAALLGPGITIATTVAVVATAAIFGLAHAFNKHKNAHIQAITTTFSGIAFGLIAVQFGLPAAIAAHMVNNTIAITLMKLGKGIVGQSDHIAPPALNLLNRA